MEENGIPDRSEEVTDVPRTLEELRHEIIALLPRLRRFARSLARDPHAADDLVQSAVERALVHADQLRPDAQASSWLFGILRNDWIDERRAQARQARVLGFADDVEGVADPSAGPPAGLTDVAAAMEQLPEEQRLAVALVLVEGMSYKDAAHVLGVPIGTLTSRLARGRDALQGLLSSDDGARS